MDKGGSKAVSLPLMTTFADLGLIPELQRALEDLGFENPTPVQEKSLQVLLNQKTDLVSLAQTGTGKTAAFGLPLLQNLDPKTRHIQGLTGRCSITLSSASIPGPKSVCSRRSGSRLSRRSCRGRFCLVTSCHRVARWQSSLACRATLWFWPIKR